MNKTINILICGKGGQGIEAAGLVLAKTLVSLGYHAFCYPESENVIHGGVNTFHLRVGKNPVYALEIKLDFILGLDSLIAESFFTDLKPTGICLMEKSDKKEYGNLTVMDVKMNDLAHEAGLDRAKNFAGLGALVSVLGEPVEQLESAIKDKYLGKSEEVAMMNVMAARLGYNSMDDGKKKSILATDGKRNISSGSQMASLGAVEAGCKFFAAYPMTPSSGILHAMAGMAKEHGISALHVEDEIAAINMAIGAGFAGARAMTSTSGGGYALMTEAIGLAGMIETPVVIAEVQRPGPSTGLPTRTAQGDLRQVLHAGQGTFPHVVLAPGTTLQTYRMMFEAFNIAEVHRCPVTILMDKYLADQQVDTELVSDLFKIDHGNRPIPGQAERIYTATSYEHNEQGNVTEDPEEVSKAGMRRMAKMDDIRRNLPPLEIEGNRDAEHTIICWGSTYGIAKEIVEKSKNINLLHFKYISPLPANTQEILKSIKKPILMENNATGQFGGWLMENLSFHTPIKILNGTGRTFYVDEVLERIKSVISI